MRVLVILLALCALSAFAAPSTKLYGLDGQLQLVSIDPVTAAMTPIGQHPVTHEAQGENLAGLDSMNKIFYFVGLNVTSQKIALVGLTLTDGSIKYEVELPFVSSAFVGVGEVCDVDSSTGDVIVMGHDPNFAKHHLMRVTPSAGKKKSLAMFEYMDVLGGGHGFDPVNQVEWIQLALNQSGKISMHLLAYDANDGKQLWDLEDEYGFDLFNFDHKTGLIWGVGIDLDAKDRFLVTLDSKTGKMDKKDTIKDYFIMAPMNTLDEKERIMYMWFEPKTTSTGQINMVEVDIDNGDVVAAPLACEKLPTCPWSVEALNA